MSATSWRDRIKVHEAANLFPMMPDAELDELTRDIAANELQHGITLWTDDISSRGRKAGPKEIFLLDGRNRLEAIDRAFKEDPEERAERMENALYVSNQPGCATLLYADYTDPVAYVISANIHRRHLTAEQKREIANTLLRLFPRRSDRAIAKMAKVDHKTVAAVRTKAEAGGEIPHHDTRTGADGVKQPSTKPPKPPSKEAQLRAMREQQATHKEDAEQYRIEQARELITGVREQQAAPAPAEAPGLAWKEMIGGLEALLRKDPSRGLYGIGRALDDAREAIAEMPLARRALFAGGYLRALDVTVADLTPAPEPADDGASPGLVKLLDAHQATPEPARAALRDWVLRAATLGGPCPGAVAEFNEVWRRALVTDQKAFRKFLLGQR
jgi:hypothetical protein